MGCGRAKGRPYGCVIPYCSIMMSFVGDMYRFFTSFRMTCFRFVVILSEAKDLYESDTINISFLYSKAGAATSSVSACGAATFP